jgi:hypothetical protein
VYQAGENKAASEDEVVEFRDDVDALVRGAAIKLAARLCLILSVVLLISCLLLET